MKWENMKVKKFKLYVIDNQGNPQSPEAPYYKITKNFKRFIYVGIKDKKGTISMFCVIPDYLIPELKTKIDKIYKSLGDELKCPI